MKPAVKKGLIVSGAALMAVVALAGWVRRPVVVTPSYLNQPNSAYTAPVTTIPDRPVVYGAQPYGSSQTVPVAQRTTTRRAYVAPRTTQKRVYYRKRSKKKSAMIIGGSAAGGAAIGALAGGGKGAAIGALAGGAGGLIYDRATHKKRVEQ